MATVSTSPEMIAELQQSFVAGIVERAKMPATRAVKLYPMSAPKVVRVESGMKASATRPTYGMVRVATYPKHFAGMDSAGYMT